MKIGADTLRVLLENNVLEIKFNRRIKSKNKPPTRRMLCTNSRVLLESSAGRKTLRFEKAYSPPSYNPRAKNLVIAWDILKQDYRAINMDSCVLISKFPVDGDGAEFWQYFNDKIYPMSAEQKEAFFNV